MAHVIKSAQVGDKTITIETGKIAKQAGGSVMISQGESVVLVAATGAAKGRPGTDFLPLTCEYRPMAYAAGGSRDPLAQNGRSRPVSRLAQE